MKWSERRGTESKCSQWSNPEFWVQYIYQYKIQHIIPNTFSNKESIAQKDSLQNQLKNFISYPLIVWGGGGWPCLWSESLSPFPHSSLCNCLEPLFCLLLQGCRGCNWIDCWRWITSSPEPPECLDTASERTDSDFIHPFAEWALLLFYSKTTESCLIWSFPN